MKGIRKTDKGWQAYVHVTLSPNQTEFRSKRFPPSATLTEMKHWREEQRVRARLGAEQLPAAESTFADDVAHYLEQVRSMATYRWRKDDLDLWLAVFGRSRDRRTITRSEIRAQLETWKQSYAASTVNHRRTALMHLWTVLDGKTAPNPARDVPRYREEDPPPRILSPGAIQRIVRAMPPSATKARVALMAATGWPQAQMMRLQPDDIRWDAAVYLRGRQKGKGVPGRWLPLTPVAWKALRAFAKLGAWGRFSTSSMRTSFRLAATAVLAQPSTPKAIRHELENVTPYMLRHAFATMVVLRSQDDRAAQELLLHGDPRQTQRYTKAAVEPRVAAAIERMTVPRTVPKLGISRKPE